MVLSGKSSFTGGDPQRPPGLLRSGFRMISTPESLRWNAFVATPTMCQPVAITRSNEAVRHKLQRPERGEPGECGGFSPRKARFRILRFSGYLVLSFGLLPRVHRRLSSPLFEVRFLGF
jgi:hypothetical protein